MCRNSYFKSSWSYLQTVYGFKSLKHYVLGNTKQMQILKVVDTSGDSLFM